MLDEIKPVAAPGDIPGYRADARHFAGHVLCPAIARHVVYRNRAVLTEGGGHDAGARLEPMHAGLQTPEVRECCDHADRAVPAHAEIRDVVEEDDARDAALVLRVDEQRPDDRIRAPRLIDDG